MRDTEENRQTPELLRGIVAQKRRKAARLERERDALLLEIQKREQEIERLERVRA